MRKTVKDTNTHITETRKYVGNWEVYETSTSGTTTLRRETLHISDDTGRIALIDTPIVSSGETQLLRYQYSNHLSTATLELDENGAVISYEEYYPYGSTSFQSGRTTAEVSRKRYRYTGKERDEESGLYYHGARYYVPWLCRWCAVDPLESKYAGWSGYNYGFDNPVKWSDGTGMEPENETGDYSNTIKVSGSGSWINDEGNEQSGIIGGYLDEVKVIPTPETFAEKAQNFSLGLLTGAALFALDLYNAKISIETLKETIVSNAKGIAYLNALTNNEALKVTKHN